MLIVPSFQTLPTQLEELMVIIGAKLCHITENIVNSTNNNNIIRTVDGRTFRPMTLMQSEQGDISQKDYTNETGSFKMTNIN